MGIHIHREGTPYNCGCCDIRERLMNLYDRTHTAVLDVNGYTPDGEGHLFIPDIQDVTDLREDVKDLKEGEEGLITAVNQNAQDIRNTRQYAEGIGENVASIDTEIHTTRPYVDTNTEQTINAVKNISVIGSSAQSIVNKDWIWKTEANADNGLLHRNGDEIKHGALTVNTLHLPKAGNADPLNYSEITSGGLKRNIMSLSIDGNNWARLILQLNPNNTSAIFLEGMSNGVYYSKTIKSSTDVQ